MTPPPLPRAPLPSLWRVAAVLLAAGAAAAVLFAIDPAGSDLYPACPFHRLTGLHCPGCGATRALHQLLRGHVAAAFDLNPLLVVLLPVAAVAFARGAARAFRGRPPRRPMPPRLAWTLAAAVVTFGLLRNLPWRPVAWMAP